MSNGYVLFLAFIALLTHAIVFIVGFLIGDCVGDNNTSSYFRTHFHLRKKSQKELDRYSRR